MAGRLSLPDKALGIYCMRLPSRSLKLREICQSMPKQGAYGQIQVKFKDYSRIYKRLSTD